MKFRFKTVSRYSRNLFTVNKRLNFQCQMILKKDRIAP